LPEEGEAAMKVMISGLVATSLILMTGAAKAGSIMDSVIANARSQLNFDECQFSLSFTSCKKHRTWARRPVGATLYETSSAKSNMLNEGPSVDASRSGSPVGQWKVDDSDRRVQIMPCGKSLCGHISSATLESVDSNNPDPAQRNRAIVNLPVLINMVQKEANRWEGQIYNTRDGRTYSGKISLRSANLLQVEGSAPHALLLQNWVKDADDAAFR
jgi:uncharacterized protein (DUF2147 family)